MALNQESIKSAKDLEQFTFSELNEYARANQGSFKSFYDRGIITNGLLKKVVINQAKKDYNWMTDERRGYNIWADHLGKLASLCFAYALKEGKFSGEEIKKIYFGDMNFNEFLKEYNREDLPSILIQKLLNPKPHPEIRDNPYCDIHPACCGD